MINQKKFLNGLIRWLPLVGLVLFFGLTLWGYPRGIFHSVAPLQASTKQFGSYAVLCFIPLQIVQVIIPILPGGVSPVAGMLMLGNLRGLLYSCLGLVIDESTGFLLTRYYGRSFVKVILSSNKYKKSEEILDKNEYDAKKLLIFIMLAPLTPDDIVCPVAGITDISLKEFMRTVLLLKFWLAATYSYLMLYLFRLFGKL